MNIRLIADVKHMQATNQTSSLETQETTLFQQLNSSQWSQMWLIKNKYKNIKIISRIK